MTEDFKVAVAMACHNRVEKSTAVVNQLLAQAEMSGISLVVCAFDDGSTDGTGDALARLGVKVVRGKGDSYWSGGMRVAHQLAVAERPDYVLWINDDLILAQDSLAKLIDFGRTAGPKSVIVGSVVDPNTGLFSYGAMMQSARNPLAFTVDQNIRDVNDSFNGNFVAIPPAVYDEIAFPRGYRHGYSDLVFGSKVKRAGFSIVNLGVVGENARNPKTGLMFSSALSLRERWSVARSPFGMPLADQLRFAWDLTGFSAPWWWLRSYIRVFFPAQGSR